MFSSVNQPIFILFHWVFQSWEIQAFNQYSTRLYKPRNIHEMKCSVCIVLSKNYGFKGQKRHKVVPSRLVWGKTGDLDFWHVWWHRGRILTRQKLSYGYPFKFWKYGDFRAWKAMFREIDVYLTWAKMLHKNTAITSFASLSDEKDRLPLLLSSRQPARKFMRFTKSLFLTRSGAKLIDLHLLSISHHWAVSSKVGPKPFCSVRLFW